MQMPDTCFGSATIEEGSPLLIENPALWAWLQIYGNTEAERMLQGPSRPSLRSAMSGTSAACCEVCQNEPALSFAKA